MTRGGCVPFLSLPWHTEPHCSAGSLTLSEQCLRQEGPCVRSPRPKNEVSAPASSVCCNSLQPNTLPSPNPRNHNDRVERNSLQGSPGD